MPLISCQALLDMPDEPRRASNVIQLLPRGPATLVERLQSGDPDAAGDLYDAFRDRVNGLVWRLLGSDSEHHDVVQQVFLNIIGSADRIEDPSALSAWVTRVTVNTVRKELRRRSRRRLVLVDDELPEPDGEALTSEEKTVVQRTYRVLAAMKEEERIVFVLRFVEGETLVEIAAACDCSLATVKRRLATARQHFLRRAQKDFFLAAALERVDADDEHAEGRS
jgi:RNA polymerase sigma-70 factor, ECF subfamily